MELSQVQAELLRTCRKLGFVVRDEPLHLIAPRRAGGLVSLHGRLLVLIDQNAPLVERVAALADTLCELELDWNTLSPDTRRQLALARARRRRERKRLVRGTTPRLSGWKVTRLLRSKPGLRHCDED